MLGVLDLDRQSRVRELDFAPPDQLEIAALLEQARDPRRDMHKRGPSAARRR
jgi:hypothetical protein